MDNKILESAESGTYWKVIIYDIVSTEGFDPWDIDVGALTDSYMERAKGIKLVNFEVPGTVILIGAVLLKLKSDIVSGQTFVFEGNLAADGQAVEEPVADFDTVGSVIPQQLMEHKLYVRRIPKRKVTLPELMIFLKRVVNQFDEKETVRKTREGRTMDVQVSKKNLERIMRDVYAQIKSLAGGKNTTFRELVDDWNRESIVAYFIPVLHLAMKDKIRIQQDGPFGEIFIAPK